MSVYQMRRWLRKQYSGSVRWVNRVNSMPDPQVIDVYFRMIAAKSK